MKRVLWISRHQMTREQREDLYINKNTYFLSFNISGKNIR